MPKIETGLLAGKSFILKQPTEPTSETLSYKTEILTSHNGTQKTRRNRPFARRFMDLTQTFTHSKSRDAINLLRENIRGDWALPLWLQSVYVGNVSGSSINLETINFDFEDQGSILVFNSKYQWQVVDVSAVNPNSLDLSQNLDFIKNAWVCPIVEAVVRGNPDIRFFSNTVEIKTRFEPKLPSDELLYIGIFITVDKGGGASPPFDYLRIEQAVKVMNELKALKNNLRFKIDFGIGIHHTTFQRQTYLDASVSDFDDAIAWLEAEIDRGLTQLDEPFRAINQVFGTDMPNDGTRRDYAFIIEHPDMQDLNGQERIFADLIDSTGAFAKPRNVKIAAINVLSDNFDDYDTFYNAEPQFRLSLDYTKENEFYYLFFNTISKVFAYSHNGLEVNIQEPISGDNEMSVSLSKIEDRNDYEVGLFDVRSPWENSRRVHDVGYFIDGQEEQALFRQRFQRSAGMASFFYQPTWQYDFQVSSVSGDTLSIFVDKGTLDAFDKMSNAFGVLDAKGFWRFYNIENVETTIQGQFKFDLDVQFVNRLDEIQLVTFIRISRFDTDEAVLEFVGDNCAQVVMPVKEINDV